ncbi:MAG: cell division protein FtsQ/DivIB [Pseudomonadota bacterium]
MFKDGKVIESQQFQRPYKRSYSNFRLGLDFLSMIHLNFLQNFNFNGRRWFFRFSLTLLILLSGILVWQKCGDPNFFPVKHIKIKGDLLHVKRDSLQQIILPFTDKGFLRLNSHRLKERLLQEEPWIASVMIKRFWPDTLAVSFTTKKPVALMANNDLLDERGDVFSAGQVNPVSLDLPLFIGPIGQQKYLLQTYQSLYPLILDLTLKIKLLKLVDQQFWYLRLSNGLALYLSREKPDVELKRFVEVYPDVIESKVSMIDYVDLRYAHGMAVKFKKRTA